VRSGPLLKKLDGSNSYREYGENSLDGTENQFRVHDSVDSSQEGLCCCENSFGKLEGGEGRKDSIGCLIVRFLEMIMEDGKVDGICL
jgi:hypothetical protein